MDTDKLLHTEEIDGTYEHCPHCDQEVVLDAELKVQTCPNCGKRIVTCSMCLACDTQGDYCTNCCLCYQAEQENLNIEGEEKFKQLMAETM